MTKTKRVIKAIILVYLLLISCITEITAQNNTIQRKQLFNSDWKFALGDASENSKTNFNDSSWRKLSLPHDWSIEGKSEKNNPSEGDGGFYPMGKAWYRKTFSVPAEWKEQKIAIYFEGVYMNAEVFINGKSVGFQPYGYTSFEFDLSPYLKFGEKNTIAVKVDNSQQKNCRWYSGSGIYRNVWLMVRNPVHVKNWGVAISTLEVKNNKATAHVKTILKNETASSQSLLLSNSMADGKGKAIANTENKIELQPNEEKEVTQIVTVENPKLWSVDVPNLYQVKTVIKKELKTLDVVTTNFGIRTMDFSAENGFSLNGKKIKLNGGCVHHDNGALGAAAYDRAEERKVELLKAAGFNAVRTSHNPPSEAFLNACDRLGMLVIDEIFDGWKEKKNTYDYASIFDKWWKHDVESMVLR
ncbi:MAG TPA: glycoside hydrolase family 2 TIM barrel-domain containing protein, partial [Flavobacterium sp.]|uniref:sugar-binding domain-containing protein n=1 Tax=Flavobacterium sp. TaxID=239 RepID=UPI002ED4A10A